MKITRHAKTRLKERNGFNKKATDRMAQKALEKGIPYSRTKGRLHQWLTAKYFKNRNAGNTRVYGDKAYIFEETNISNNIN